MDGWQSGLRSARLAQGIASAQGTLCEQMHDKGIYRHDGRSMDPSSQMQLRCHRKGRCHTHRWQVKGDEVLCSGPVHVVAGGADEGAQPCHCGVCHIQHLQYSADLSKARFSLQCKRWLTCALVSLCPSYQCRQCDLVKLTKEIAFPAQERISTSYSGPCSSISGIVAFIAWFVPC